MVELRENGSVNVTEGRTSYVIAKKDGVKATVTTKSGDTCTMQAQGQSISTSTTAIILSEDGKQHIFIAEEQTTQRNTANSATISNDTLDEVAAKYGFSSLLETITGHPQVNTDKSVATVGNAMKGAGITCVDPSGKPTTPVLSVGNARQLAEGLVGPKR
jgi:hypothetical protein